MPKLKEVRYDVDFSSPEPTAAQISSATSFVTSKGFCVSKWSVAADTLAQVAEDVKRLKLNNALKALPAELDDGFLGAEGSSAMLSNFESSKGLEALEAQLSAVTAKMHPIIRTIAGSGTPDTSATSLHVTAEPEDEDDRPELTDALCQQHVKLFTTQRLMLVYFLGPGQGTIEMEPFGMLGVNPYVLTTEPGMLIVLRADMLSHRHFSPRETSAISCFISQESAESAPVRTPTSELLRSFAQERMMTLKGGVEDSQLVPSEWMDEMSKRQIMGPQVACRAISAKFPGSWDAKEWWYTTLGGIDSMVEVPHTRWDVNLNYDPEPTSYKQWKTCSKHSSFIEGLHLFDNKFFSLSPAETKVMDPQQRHILEVSYDALAQSGFTKKLLMRSLIGVFLGCSCQAEWGMVPQEGDGGGAATTGGAASIHSNRISFCLGMQGPSYTLDLQAAASMAAITNGYNSQRYQTEKFMPCHTAIVGGMYLSFAVQNFIMCCAQGFMSNKGRSLTYDATANGWAKGEGLSVMTLQKQGDVVDGKTVLDDKPSLANLSASAMSHVGSACNLNAPNGPVEQEVMHTALQQAQLNPSDIAAVEPVGDGRFLFDAAEVMATSNAFRLNESSPLIISACKTNSGMMHEVTGMAQVIKIVYSLRAGLVGPMNHLSELNQHIDIWSDSDVERPVQFATEAIGTSGLRSFMGASARAQGGTVAHVIFGVDVDPKERPSFVTPSALPTLSFWPGGGGKLEDSYKPRDSYCIVGSWSRFSEAVPMEKDGKDVYSYFVTIGSNGFEQFQISLDGDLDKMLTPETPQAAAYTSVQGPVSEEDSKGLHWVIGAPVTSSSQTALTSGAAGTTGTASPGDVYAVRLRIAGRWRTVDWEFVEQAKDKGAAASNDDGQYFVAGSFSSWACDHELEKVGPGKYQAEVALTSSRCRFQVVRNRDWSQMFYPVGSDVMGPGSASNASSWEVTGESGDAVRITLQRSCQNGSWSQTVTQEKVASRPATDLAESAWPRYFLAGAGSPVKYELEPLSQLSYGITLQLTDGPVPFQILYDGDFRRAFYPSVKSANASVPHTTLGPDVAPNKMYSWLIKRDLDDTSEEGGWYTVELSVSAIDRTPTAVRWYRTG